MTSPISSSFPRAFVHKGPDGQLVLDDPDALAIWRAVEKHNCKATLEAQKERVVHFVGRIAARGLSGKDVVIVLLNVDDPHGGQLADILMPGHDWQEHRDRGEVPFARGLAARGGIEDALALFDQEAAEKLRAESGVAIVVVDYGVAEIFRPEDLL